MLIFWVGTEYLIVITDRVGKGEGYTDCRVNGQGSIAFRPSPRCLWILGRRPWARHRGLSKSNRAIGCEVSPLHTERIKAFVEDHPVYPTRKEYFSSSKAKAMHQTENFEKWGFRANLVLDDSTYQAAFLGCWLVSLQFCCFLHHYPV